MSLVGMGLPKSARQLHNSRMDWGWKAVVGDLVHRLSVIQDFMSDTYCILEICPVTQCTPLSKMLSAQCTHDQCSIKPKGLVNR